MADLLVIEVEREEDAYHASVIDLSDDAVLHVTSSFACVSDAVRAAKAWMEENQ